MNADETQMNADVFEAKGLEIREPRMNTDEWDGFACGEMDARPTRRCKPS